MPSERSRFEHLRGVGVGEGRVGALEEVHEEAEDDNVNRVEGEPVEEAADRDHRAEGDQKPLAFEAVGDQGSEEAAQRCPDRRERDVEERLLHAEAFLGQQGRRPAGEAEEADGLSHPHDAEQDRRSEVLLLQQQAPLRLGLASRRRPAGRGRAAVPSPQRPGLRSRTEPRLPCRTRPCSRTSAGIPSGIGRTAEGQIPRCPTGRPAATTSRPAGRRGWR